MEVSPTISSQYYTAARSSKFLPGSIPIQPLLLPLQVVGPQELFSAFFSRAATILAHLQLAVSTIIIAYFKLNCPIFTVK